MNAPDINQEKQARPIRTNIIYVPINFMRDRNNTNAKCFDKMYFNKLGVLGPSRL